MSKTSPLKNELPSDEIIVSQTQAWIKKVIIACNFCPFAQREVQRGSIRYLVVHSEDIDVCMEAMFAECGRLDEDENIETTLVIFPGVFTSFKDYLLLIENCEDMLVVNDYEGVYQVASFHQDYQFAGTLVDDAANYTNRSLYPMLHLLRETSIDRALDNFPNPENIPQQNIEYAHKMGLQRMKLLRDACWNG
ncbi:MAG: DUF1415 domain-containing protein [Haliscomenobacter sp.]|uniref:DUF1415 domain-containing protein n=1 Tax=Haliscomenobacter sp. TaxID=2717303 RepID=UPI0029A7D393|nr:DUF1415 domain-containing protein [Haliscomenobacter sp.]MDX2067935.1 DUF1415 domain-containing protein [Haliscomenobacter sp.]